MLQLKLTAEILSAALEGFEAQKERVDARIAEIKQMLDGHGTREDNAETKGKRRLPSQDGTGATTTVEEDQGRIKSSKCYWPSFSESGWCDLSTAE